MILAPTLSILSSGSGAIVRPTFSRDFAGEKTLNNGTGPAITFARGSTATYFDASGVLQTASTNVPRFDHDPATGNASRGLLIEESRQNLLQRSEEFDNAYWGKIDATVVDNAATSPASTLTADRVHPSTNSSASVFFRNGAASASTAYSASLFMKAAGKTFGFLQINFNQSGTPIRAFAFTIDLSNGTLGDAARFSRRDHGRDGNGNERWIWVVSHHHKFYDNGPHGRSRVSARTLRCGQQSHRYGQRHGRDICMGRTT